MKEKTTLLDQAGYNELIKNIEATKQELNRIRLERNEALQNSDRQGWGSTDLQDITRKEEILLSALRRKMEILDNFEIIEKHNKDGIVDIGDTICTELIYQGEEHESLTFKLVASEARFDSEIKEISINSPLGNSVFGKYIGEETSYSVNGMNVLVLIKEKLEIENEQVFTKSLSIRKTIE